MRGQTRYVTAPKPITHPVAAPGVKVALLEPGFLYSGTPGALIAAGLALPGWLPGDPACPNRGNFTIHVDGRRVQIDRTACGAYRATYGASSEEFEAAHVRWEAERNRKNRREAAAKQVTAAANELAALPSSETEYREKHAHMTAHILSALLHGDSLLTGGASGSGYRFAPEFEKQFNAAARGLIEVIRQGRVIFDPTVRQATIAKIHAKTTGADPIFAKMLSTIVAGAKEQ